MHLSPPETLLNHTKEMGLFFSPPSQQFGHCLALSRAQHLLKEVMKRDRLPAGADRSYLKACWVRLQELLQAL